MKKILIYIFFIIYSFSFSKQVEINFSFDIDSGLIYYSNADIDSIGNLNTVEFNKKNLKLTLKDGVYIFGFYDKKNRYLFKKFYITNDRDFKISFIPQKSIFLEGIILENEKPIKDIKITFIDSMGREYSTTSSSNGKYSISLPPEKYLLLSSQFGYEVFNEVNFDFSQPNSSYNIPVKIKKSLGKINGKILGDNGFPLTDATIFISNDKENQIVYSDRNGNFNISLKEGITSMKISKVGYNSKGFIKNFTRKDTISLQTFILNKEIFFISGTIANKTFPLKNQDIYLFSEKGALLDKTSTNENGNFKFSNIKNEKIYIYIPENDIYESYKSDLISIKDNISNMNLILKNK